MKTFIFVIWLANIFTLGAQDEVIESTEEINTALDFVWVLIATAMVFLMQAGFMFLESGMSQSKNSVNVAIKNAADFVLAVGFYWIVGYGFMFGVDLYGWGIVGFDSFFFHPKTPWDANIFIFQAVFCGTAATITSGAIAGRAKFFDYLILSVLVSAIIYPVFGHWVWGGGWLSEMGFLVFAGSTVVHSTGGWVALAGIIVIGPRLGKFDENGQSVALPPNSILSAYLGGLLLVFGWFGFNCGSTLAASDAVATIGFNTLLAACFGGIPAMVLSWRLGHLKLPEPQFIINGILAGLVGITAGCDAVTPLGAVVIGLSSGALSYFAVLWIENKLKLDDVVGAVTVHGICGAWGTFIFPVFTQNENILKQLGIQLVGIFACFIWVFSVSLLVLKFIKKYWGLRIDRDSELVGLNVSEHGVQSTLLDLARSMHEVKQGKDIENCQEMGYQKGTEMGDLVEGYNAMLRTIKQSLKESALQKDIAEAAKMKVELSLEKLENSQKGLESALQNAEDSKDKAREALEISEVEKRKTEQLLKDLSERERLKERRSAFLEEHSKESSAIVGMLMTATEQISNESQRVIGDVSKLAEYTRSITLQLSGLSKITDTTRLLSFNASIESAKHGEAGKSFSVLASEVRALAESSSDFAEEIYKSISEFESQFESLSNSVNSQEEQTILMTKHIKSLQHCFDKLDLLESASQELTAKLRA